MLLKFLRSCGEPLLWIGFLIAAVASLDGSASENTSTVAGLFVLAAIGVRATRSDNATPSTPDNVAQ